MIKTNFMKECENCPHLQVTQNSFKFSYINGDDKHEHTITCENMEKCRSIKEHLEKELNKFYG